MRGEKARQTRIRAAALAAAILAIPVAHAIEVIDNGSFETGDLSGWQTANVMAGSFSASQPGANSPLSNSPTSTNPLGGTTYAVADQDSFTGGANVLFQDFHVAGPVSAAFLSFDLFVTDWAGFGAIVDSSGLDPTTGGVSPARDNQHARIDLMAAGSDPFSATNGVLANLYLDVDPDLPALYQQRSFDLTNLLASGGDFRLRFAVVENLAPIQMGVDNVSLEVTPVPEPTTGAGLAIAFFVLRRRRKVSVSASGRA